MKSTGIVRKIDELGRVVLPIEIRRTLDIDVRDPMEIFIDEDSIILKKHESSCIFCGNAKDNIIYKNRHVCRECLKEMKLSEEQI